ncbi:hypothetical protein NP493_692g02016 [Ridgeia piscesae]|uniref:Uncharacterized protein n=1 Tax=Ridgeia piscesae TaxID=27915 RepID=A0AAD9KRG9_RIDPI|nr:hypothetical protein NP493_692g02016 [Ridgeia piscesae]
MRYQPHLVTWKRVVAATALAVVLLMSLAAITRHPATSISITSGQPVSVIVVEEHHEGKQMGTRFQKPQCHIPECVRARDVARFHSLCFLPYWIQAANEGIIPKSGNTLVHIDGHSDEALLQLMDQMAFFDWPSSDEQVQVLMQRNDVFITGAVMSGLIDRIIFIYPSWDSSVEGIYEKKSVGLGWMNLTIDGAVRKHFCVCAQMIEGGIKECLYEDPFPKTKDPEVELQDPSKCAIMRHYTVEHIVEFVRLKLSRKISELFCPKDIDHESLSNHVMQNVMKAMIENHSGRLQNLQNDMCNGAYVKMHSITENIIKKFWRAKPTMFCSDDETTIEQLWETIMRRLCMFSLHEFTAVMNLGFCLSTSPATLGFGTQGVGNIEVCHGANVPNDSVVFLHSPGVVEVDGRMALLNQVLKFIDSRNPPKFVTVCRSVRDGYTPREHFTKIEAGILKIFQRLSMPYSATYDQNLLGGRQGWPNRHTVIKQKKQKFKLPGT